MQYRAGIEANVIGSMRVLCFQAPNYGKIHPSNVEAVNAFNDLKSDDERLTPRLAGLVLQIWKDSAIRNAYENRSKFQISESCVYFFEKVNDIINPAYIPTLTDIIRVRIRTTGIVENDFQIETTKFKMFDVGGQRNERKKWIHCFEGVTAVLFVVALSEYDELLFEDEKTNRMQEALTLFEEQVNSSWFKKSSMVLFLNKRDLFLTKISKVPLKVCFPTYSGANTYDAGVEYIKRVFEGKNKDPQKLIYTHVVCATDQENVHRVFASVKDTVIRVALNDAGLLT
jgi:hypothetical protein